MKRNILKFGIGYLIAVFVAVCVAEAILLGPTIFPDQGRFGSFYRQLQDMPAMFFVGFVYTFGTALPGYATTLFLAHRNTSHSWMFYCIGGGLTALSAHLILAAILGVFVVSAYIVFVCSVPGGIAGAYAYSLWREKLTSIWAKNSDITIA